jgi:hypothetical protein
MRRCVGIPTLALFRNGKTPVRAIVSVSPVLSDPYALYVVVEAVVSTASIF